MDTVQNIKGCTFVVGLPPIMQISYVWGLCKSCLRHKNFDFQTNFMHEKAVFQFYFETRTFYFTTKRSPI